LAWQYSTRLRCYTGVSTDPKPTTGIDRDSLAYEYDTGNVYIFDATTWCLKSTGIAATVQIGAALPAGTNNIGDVDVASLPALPAGTNVIGKVGIDTAANTVKIDSSNNTVKDNDVGAGATGITMPAGGSGKLGWLSGIYDRLSKVVLAAGTAIIGKVGIDQTTDGTTNRVVAKISQAAGENVVTTADGGIATIGAKADAAVVDPTLSASEVALLKGIMKQLQGAGSGAAPIALASGTPTTATLQNAAGAVGNGTSMDVSGLAVATLDVQGTFVATVVFEGSVDDTVWYPLNATNLGTGLIASSTTGNGVFQISVAGLKSIRARISAWTSGTITVKGRGTPLAASEKAVSITGSLANVPIDIKANIETTTSAPVVGVKTVTATAAEIFAGASAKASRRKLIIKNEDSILRFRIGSSSVTQQTGFPVEPGASVEFQFDPTVVVPIYAISEGANLNVAVMEL